MPGPSEKRKVGFNSERSWVGRYRQYVHVCVCIYIYIYIYMCVCVLYYRYTYIDMYVCM